MFGRFQKKNQLKSGYQKKPAAKKKHPDHYVRSLIVAPSRKVGWVERLIKFMIYLALRLVIKPSKWKDPEKNYEIIDRTYKRIHSADMVFIPSSIAFYLIMAFMPILSLMAFLYSLDDLKPILCSPIIDATTGHQAVASDGVTLLWDSGAWTAVIGKFIPGADSLLKGIGNLTDGTTGTGGIIGTLSALVISTWIAASGFSKLVYTQSYVYQHKFTGGYWMNKMRGMTMVLVFTLFLVVALTINMAIERWINSWNETQLTKTAMTYFFLVVGLYVGLFIGFILLFKFSPRFKIKAKNVIPGAMVSTIPTAGFLAFFGIITSFWHYGSYGAIGSIMYIGMASLIIVYFIFVGIIANAAYYKTFVAKTMRNKFTLSRK